MEADEQYYVTANLILELAYRSKEIFEGSEPEQKRQIITITLQNLRIKNGKLEYDWYSPFDKLFKVKKASKKQKRHIMGG